MALERQRMSAARAGEHVAVGIIRHSSAVNGHRGMGPGAAGGRIDHGVQRVGEQIAGDVIGVAFRQGGITGVGGIDQPVKLVIGVSPAFIGLAGGFLFRSRAHRPSACPERARRMRAGASMALLEDPCCESVAWRRDSAEKRPMRPQSPRGA